MFNWKGMFVLSFNPDEVVALLRSSREARVINMEEDNSDTPILDPANPYVISGTLLLPPVEALWAFYDGNGKEFQRIYYEYLHSKEVYDYISLIITAAYNGTKFIIYFSDKDSPVIKYLYNYLYEVYGLHISMDVYRDPFVCTVKAIAPTVIALYSNNFIDPYDFLMEYPHELQIPQQMYNKLLADLRLPHGYIQDQMAYVDCIRENCKNGRRSVCPFISAEV